ncbi:MAG TPA: hypothetical protein VN760_08730 [Casimicrobiaceae bacterium]|nr:hypothetical protein [Casimicrobiaceae bacterium]
MPLPTLHRIALVALVALAGGCAGIDQRGDTSGPVAAAPSPAVGARWTYRGREGFRVPVVWEETHEVTALGASGITIRVTQKGPTLDVERQEVLAAPGVVRTGALMDVETRRFTEPLIRYRFPLAPGEAWNQWVDNFNETTNKAGQINRYVRVGGWEKVSTPAGVFDAIRMRVMMRLDDEEFWRYPTTCNYLVWYAPAVGAPVREEKDAEYYERGEEMDGQGAIRAQHTLLELTSYSPGRG